jgi:hypothetical protein
MFKVLQIDHVELFGHLLEVTTYDYSQVSDSLSTV